MKKTIHCLCILFLLNLYHVNAQNYYQYLKTSSKDLSIKNDCYYTESDGIAFYFSNWGENGLLQIMVINNSDKPIYIDWKKSILFENDNRKNLWEDKTIINTTGTSNSISTNILNPFVSFQKSNFQSISVVKNDEQITFIPQNSAITKTTCALSYNLIKMITMSVNLDSQSCNRNIIYGFEEYNENNSPLTNRIFITYSKNQDFSDEKYIDKKIFVAASYIFNEQDYGYLKAKSASNTHYLLPFINNPINFYHPFSSKKKILKRKK